MHDTITMILNIQKQEHPLVGKTILKSGKPYKVLSVDNDEASIWTPGENILAVKVKDMKCLVNL